MDDNKTISCGTYVFLANRISGISGGPLYVRNKKRFLESKGWKVMIITQKPIVREPIIIDEFKQYSENEFAELAFPPSWISNIGCECIIKKSVKLIGNGSNIVIESNQVILALWGELIAKRLQCTHIVYLINEIERLNDIKLCDYFYNKLLNNALFCINSKSCKNLFSIFHSIDNPDQYVWKAGCDNDVEDVYNERLDAIKRSDFNIGFFGRMKPFVPDMFKEVFCFCNNHKELKINLLCLGMDAVPVEIKHISFPQNISVFVLGNASPIPKSFFEKTDVIIATAACASVSYRQKSVVISMNVETHKPLGIMGLTANTSTFASPGKLFKEDASLGDELDFVLNSPSLKSKIDFEMITRSGNDNNYASQLDCINFQNSYYNTATLFHPKRLTHFLQFIAIKTLGSEFVLFVKHMFMSK